MAEAAETRTITARAAAVKAQESAAGALEEANRIAEEAKQVVEGFEARKLEHHNLRWEVKWDSPSGVWSLVNRGPDGPKSVELTAYSSFYGHRDPVRADSVPVGSSVQVEFEAWAGGGGALQVEWGVAWRTSRGARSSNKAVRGLHVGGAHQPASSSIGQSTRGRHMFSVETGQLELE